MREEQEELYRIFEQSPAVVFLWKNAPGWPVVNVSENVKHLFGYSAQEFRSTDLSYAQLLHPDDLERVSQEVKMHSDNKETSAFVHEPYRIITRDGRTRWIDDRTSIRRGATGVPEYYQGIVLDITDRVEAEEALARSKQELKRSLQVFEAIIEALPGMVTVVDKEFRVITANSAVVRAFGGTDKSDAIGKKCYKVRKGLDDVCPQCGIARAFRSGRLESRASTPEEEALMGIATMAYATPLLDDAGEVWGGVEVIMDITERVTLEREKEKLAEQFYQAQKLEAVGQLAGGVAHDFNNMLCAILGNAEVLMEDLGGEDKARARLTEIAQAAKKASLLTQQLLAFSRKQLIQPRVLDLGRLIENMHSMLVRVLGEDVILKTDAHGQAGCVKLDPGQAEQIVLNLAVNARDAMPDGGELHIEAQQVKLDEDYCRDHLAVPGDYMLLSVSDTGIGMDEETRSRIFEPFFSTKEEGHGTGLGLAMVHGIVEQNSGRIDVYSEVGQGTTFKIFLPLVKDEAEEVGEQPAEEYPTGQETVLLVEDNEMVRRMAQNMLDRLGYTVIAAASGREAIERVKRTDAPIDLLLTDVVMPRMNGRQLVEAISRIRPGIRTLFASGYTRNVIAHQGVLDGDVHFIPKPYTFSALAVAVRAALDSKPGSP